MKKTALITGASSGIGMELARLHAENGGDLVLVARSEEKMKDLAEELKEKFESSTTIIVKDLTEEKSAHEIYDILQSKSLKVDYLINNAGFGGYGYFHERDNENLNAMMKVNMISLTWLMKVFLPDMIEQKSGKIMNISSTAGFLPGPLQAVYHATKSYVLSLSQAIDEEVRKHGITVTAIAPGPVDTNFEKVADLEGSTIFKQAASARSVAEKAYSAMMKGKLVAITDPGIRFAFRWLMPLVGRRARMKAVRRAMESGL